MSSAPCTSFKNTHTASSTPPDGSPTSSPLKLNYMFQQPQSSSATSPLKSIPLKWKSFLSLNSVPSSPIATRSNTPSIPAHLSSPSNLSTRSNSPSNPFTRHRRPSFFGFSKSQLSNSSTFLHSRFHSNPPVARQTRLRSTSDDVVFAAAMPFRGRSPSPVKETFYVNHQYATDSPINVPSTLFPTTLDFPVPIPASSLPNRYLTPEPGMSQTPSPTSSPRLVLLINQYLILDEIGSGSFGKVVKVYNTDDQTLYACKIISKSRLKRKFRFRSDSEQQCDIRREIAIFKKLSCGHPNVTTLLEVLDAQDQDNLYLVFELCYKPIMKLNMDEQVCPYSEPVALKYFRDVVLGLEYLHSQRVIHCDLKPENILITWDDRAQIADFGIAHMCEDESGTDHIPNRTGSPAFTPPECCQSHMDTVPGRTFDIWCLGVTLYCLTHGRVPFYSDSVLDLYTAIVSSEPVYSPTISLTLQALLASMLVKDPALRISVPEIISHDWVTTSASVPLHQYDDLIHKNVNDFGLQQDSVTEDDMNSALSHVGLLSKLWTKFRSRRKSSSFAVAPPSPCSVMKDVLIKEPTGPVLSIQNDAFQVPGELESKPIATIDSAYPVSPVHTLRRK